MFHIPDFYHDLSLTLSDVLDDIGVSEAMIMKWRKATFLTETMETITRSPEKSVFKFGSLSEGTTTVGLDSDTDTLFCYNTWTVVKDNTEWQPGLTNLLMIKNDDISPGYCHLQVLRSDLPLPSTQVRNRHFIKVKSDIVLLQNTFHKSEFTDNDGPSCVSQGGPGIRNSDLVFAFRCKSWPIEARQWLHRGGVDVWPTSEMKRFAENSGFFVVPVGSRVSQNEALEWRISTSLAERCFMLSLNITQVRCYILMKMILKTYLNSQNESHISSFMGKTVLLYCIENTQPSAWKDFNLIPCLYVCLQRLSLCVISRSCPHYFIPGNNLMAGKFSGHIKDELQDKLLQIMQNNKWALFGIRTDDLGARLKTKLNMSNHLVPTLYSTSNKLLLGISTYDIRSIADRIPLIRSDILHESFKDRSEIPQQRLIQFLHRYTTAYRYGSLLEQTASILLAPLISSTMGTIIAALHFKRNNEVSSEAIDWLHLGINSDVSSGRLKLASVLYCMGDMVRTEVILTEIERRYYRRVVAPVCDCYDFKESFTKGFAEVTNVKNIVQSVKENISFCVKFTPAEINCSPKELQYELFRSTWDDLLQRDMYDNYWMNWAVVDSLPYLYFLQYKTYGRLQRYADQQLALNNLLFTIMTERNLGHRETAYNLFGQCMEQENHMKDAMFCYQSSLNIRERNNVARFHICRLLATLLNQDMH